MIKYKKYCVILLIFSLYTCLSLQLEKNSESYLLKGKPISSEESSKLLNNAFDGNINTEYKSSNSPYSWIGLEFDSVYRITKVGWAQKENNSTFYLLGIFEGSNDPTFMDAIPLYMIKDEVEKSGQVNYVDIDVTDTFKYVRYIGPYDQGSIISILEFYGHEIKDDEKTVNTEEEKCYQPTELPLVIIHTENSVDPEDKETEINCNIVIVDKGKKNANSIGVIKLRGNSTMRMDKSPYKIKFEKAQKILDLPAKAKKWNLMANHSDRTLLRTLLGFKISSLFEIYYTPQCRSVDVMVNGDYKGNYNLCDNIEYNENRIKLDELNSETNSEPEISGGYLLEATNYAYQDNFYINTTGGIIFGIRYPKEEDITPQQFMYIQDKLNEMEADAYCGIVDKIDFESFTKYLLTQELSGHSEIFWSTYMTKRRNDDKFYFGPVWDFDLAFDNDNRAYPTLNKTNFLFKYDSSAGTMREFAVQLLNNEELLQALKDKWIEMTEKKVTKEIIVNFIDEQVKKINDSQKLNFKRWKVLDRRILASPTARCTYKREVEYLKDYIQKRFDQVGEIIESSTTSTVNEEVKHFDIGVNQGPGAHRESKQNEKGGFPGGGAHGGKGNPSGSGQIIEECINFVDNDD